MRNLLIVLLIAYSAYGQTLANGGGSGGGGGGSSTASAIRSGLLAAIPATCTGGAGASQVDVYYATDASIATGLSKFYVCTATNTWTQQGAQGNSDGSITITSSASGLIDIQVTAGVFATIAGNNSFTGNNSFATGTFSAASATHTIPQQVVATDPATCTVGEKYTDTTASPAVDYTCLTTNTWTRVSTTPWSNVQTQLTRVTCTSAGQSDLFTTTIPAGTIPAGKCIHWVVFVQNDGGGGGGATYRMKFGSFSSSILANNNDTTILRFEGYWCNTPAATNAQQLTTWPLTYNAGVNFVAAANGVITTSAIDTTAAVTASFTGQAQTTDVGITPLSFILHLI